MIVYQALKWYWEYKYGKEAKRSEQQEVALQNESTDDANIDGQTSEISETDSLEEEFEKASSRVRANANKLTLSDGFELYGLYKRATTGKADLTDRPGRFDIMKRRRFEAWYSLNALSESEAMARYILKVYRLLGSSKETGPGKSKSCFGMRPSVPMQRDSEDEAIEEGRLTPEIKGWFHAVYQLDFALMDEALEENPRFINMRNENGMTALHYASDLGRIDLMKYLIEKKADINATDEEGQTALHYASECGHHDAVVTLIDAGADPTIATYEGNCPIEVASDQKICQLLKAAMNSQVH